MPMIDFWCELASTYTYLSVMRVDASRRPQASRCAGDRSSSARSSRRRGGRRRRSRSTPTRAALLGIEEGWGKDFVKRVMHAGFAEDRDIASAEVLDAVLVDVGIEGAAARARATSPERGPALRRATEEAMNLRIFGAPTFLVGEEMFWGNDQLEAAIAWAARGEASRRGA